MAELEPESGLVLVGRVGGAYGVRGWVKVNSGTTPSGNILHYSPWRLRTGDGWHSVDIEEGRVHGKGVVARLAGCRDRDQAAALAGTDIAVCRAQLPALVSGEVYWVDLVGLEVTTLEGVALGRVTRLMATGANDVLVVNGERERLIPYIGEQVIVEVDQAAGTILVDWDPDF